MSYDGMRRIPCFFCDWRIAYDPAVPGLREHSLERARKHMITHSAKFGVTSTVV